MSINTCPECNFFLGNAGHKAGCPLAGISPAMTETLAEAMRDLIEECESHPDNPDPDTLATAKNLLREWDEWRKT